MFERVLHEKLSICKRTKKKSMKYEMKHKHGNNITTK